MAHILVMGASSGIGLETVRIALERGHRVRAFARTASRVDIDHADLELCDGNALDRSAVEAALDDVDAVIQCLGVKLQAQTVLSGTDLFSEATRVLIPAMKSHNVDRLLVVTGYGAGDSGSHINPFYRLGFNAVLARIYSDKSVQEDLVKESELEWTIARPVVLTGGSCGHYEVFVDPSKARMGIISRSSVADFLVTEIEQGNYIHQAPILN